MERNEKGVQIGRRCWLGEFCASTKRRLLLGQHAIDLLLALELRSIRMALPQPLQR
jgi:hypothetical protein